ncbi:hypothetical protein SH584_05335 [Sphingomonas sp. LY29]|uniref:DUF7010 family protein n=1 Tax=Sphingomonas sp. LY29 TaxID=3095341 RepID=UPI002D7802DF|nr:hypothetical protein [Sphingomonas sp. LY29]WRP26850.1 hypothetical protein SH584_05335 [Sphingomonas sp. LY29]
MSSLDERREQFLAASTISMPLAGLIVWSAIGIAAIFVPKTVVGWMAVYAMAAVLPLAFIIEKLRGRNPFAKDDNPISALFFHSIIGIGLMFPLVIGAASAARDPDVMVLGVAILAGIIWIPYGWGANDPVGLRHAIVRAVGCYVAFWFAPDALKATMICAVVAAAYLYSLAAMRRPAKVTVK